MNVGIDIVDISRMKRLIKDRRFLNKVFTREEIVYCSNRKNRIQHFAVRFAAKEAVWKALGKDGLWFKDISVKNSPEGKPEIILKKLKKFQKRLSISLSHSKTTAVAVALFK